MASRVGPRSVKDATRFTSNIPHATSKASAAAAPKPTAASRLPGETPEQRVRRLRQAHLAARNAQVSKTDKAIDMSRRFLNVAHQFTVGGVILFTAVAGIVSVYSVWDMLRYNKARRVEWVEAQKKLEADELATARLAYLKGEATEEQIELVEEANREAERTGVKLPPLLPPAQHRTHFEESLKPALTGEQAVEKLGSQSKGILAFFGIGGSSEQEEGQSSSESSVQTIEDKAKQAWEQEKEKQRQGGSLDQLGLETSSQNQGSAKKGWWPW